jgi:asparagine synthase (glutamine-hydrolysing)
MADALAHRGPDAFGEWNDPVAGVGLAHRRLSILDLSPEGGQPMLSACGRYAVVFNGEIYNHDHLRSTLSPHSWRGHSDTEVMLEAFSRWGVENALPHFIGMFALAVWDRTERSLLLARDRFGEKPLYYSRLGGTWVFASELKALRADSRFPAQINRDALAAYLRYGCIPAPSSIYEGVYKLPPGSFLRIRPQSSAEATPQPYWSCLAAAERVRADMFAGSDSAAVDSLETVLRDAVGRQCIADVPLGAFLSGGVDSSLIVALMQTQSARPIRTFTIGFREWGYDEVPHAAAVAKCLGTEHTELYVEAGEARSVIPHLPDCYDEPFADSSQIPTYLVAKLARNHVTVALSGDGGDELFGGYNRHVWASRMQAANRKLPFWARRRAAQLIKGISPARWDAMFRCLPVRLPSTPGDKLHKLARALGADSPGALYDSFVSQWSDPAAILLGGRELAAWALPPGFGGGAEQMQLADTKGYLPDDILVKVDRATMALSLESRAPFLDHSVFEFAWRLPQSLKIRSGSGKWVLRQLLYRYVPRELIERPKAGFGVPIDSWLRGPLREWAEALLDESRLRQEGFFRPEPIRQVWREHLSGTRNWQHQLWIILMFQAWNERWL